MPDYIDKIKLENTQKQFKHANENYDDIIDKACPITTHRGDTSTVNRLLGYTDATMATCATFLVLPLRNLKEMHEGQSLTDFISEKETEFIVFFLGFLVICTIWESINMRCIVVKRLDDFLVLLSMLQMFIVTVLPFSLALQGHFPHEEATVVITVIVLIAVELVELGIIFYAFANLRLIHYVAAAWTTEERRKFRLFMCLKPIANLVIVMAAGLFSLLDYRISYVLVSLLIMVPVVRKLTMFMYRRVLDKKVTESCTFFHFYSKGNISKERVEAFTDAAVAIIACVLILDITVEEFPKREKVLAHGLLHELKHMGLEFIIFSGTYLSVSFLWYVNHTILHLFHTINIVVLYLQKIFLVFLCLAPLASSMLNKFIRDEDTNTKVAIRVYSISTFISSMCNLLMLIYGYHRNEKFVHEWAAKRNAKQNRHQHLYVLLKSCNLPFWSIIAFLGSFAPNGGAPRVIFDSCVVCNHVSFIILKLIFLKINRQKMRFDEQADESEENMMKDQRIVDQNLNMFVGDNEGIDIEETLNESFTDQPKLDDMEGTPTEHKIDDMENKLK